jgi:hypothetical protein
MAISRVVLSSKIGLGEVTIEFSSFQTVVDSSLHPEDWNPIYDQVKELKKGRLDMTLYILSNNITIVFPPLCPYVRIRAKTLWF